VNLGQLRTSLQTKGYATDSATAQTEMLNSVYRALAGKRRWPWMEAQATITLVAGTAAYSIAAITDWLHPDAARVEIGTEYPVLEYQDPQAFRDLAHQDRDRGVPQLWTWARGQLHVWPSPDRAYTLTVDYTKDPPDLSSDSDTPIFAATYHDVLVWGALKEIAFRQRDWGAHQYAKQEYDARFGEMERAYGLRQRQTSGKVKESGFYSQWSPMRTNG
jgi:hypothetical protein